MKISTEVKRTEILFSFKDTNPFLHLAKGTELFQLRNKLTRLANCYRHSNLCVFVCVAPQACLHDLNN